MEELDGGGAIALEFQAALAVAESELLSGPGSSQEGAQALAIAKGQLTAMFSHVAAHKLGERQKRRGGGAMHGGGAEGWGAPHGGPGNHSLDSRFSCKVIGGAGGQKRSAPAPPLEVDWGPPTGHIPPQVVDGSRGEPAASSRRQRDLVAFDQQLSERRGAEIIELGLRQKEDGYDHPNVGRRVSIYWDSDKEWYDGWVLRYDSKKREYLVHFDFGIQAYERLGRLSSEVGPVGKLSNKRLEIKPELSDSDASESESGSDADEGPRPRQRVRSSCAAKIPHKLKLTVAKGDRPGQDDADEEPGK